MKTPEADDLRFAAEWLRMYDDSHDGGAQSAVAEAVAKWLDAQADAKELRAAAAEHGIPVSRLRSKLAQLSGASSGSPGQTTGTDRLPG
jgi:hypothetical protein